MTRTDNFSGSLAIIIVLLWTGDMAAQAIISHPNWVGVIYALADLYGGFLIGSSVWRDRL
jgi:hypothetical protein